MDIPKEQWQAMAPSQQMEAREKQAELDKVREERRALEARNRQIELENEKAALALRRQEAGPGERVQCVLSSAEAKLASRWLPIEPVAFDLVTGMGSVTEIQAKEDRRRSDVYADFDGMKVRICPSQRSNEKDCAVAVATQSEYRRGVVRELEKQDFLKGRLRCDLPLNRLTR